MPSPWRVPVRYGYTEAVQSAGTIVAPLLAGFTITLIGILVSEEPHVRYPDVALAILSGAVAFLLAAVQCSYAARQFLVTPGEMTSWWPGLDEVAAADRFKDGSAKKRYAEQRAHSALCARWTARFRFTYHAGTMFVLLALVVVLIPPAGEGSLARSLAVGIAALASLGEAAWIGSTFIVGPGERLRRFRGLMRAPAQRIVPSYKDELQRAETDVEKLAREVASAQARVDREAAAAPRPSTPPERSKEPDSASTHR